MIEHVTFCTTKGIGLLLSVTKLANRCWVLPVTVCRIKLIHLLRNQQLLISLHAESAV